MKKIVIIPTYNERENIQKMIPAILSVDLGLDILVVDDNSPDKTSAVVKKLVQTIKNKKTGIFVLDRTKKDGLGKAYIAGFNWALKHSYEIIVQMDADFSHNPKYLLQILKEIEKYDLVIGSRYVKGGGVENWGFDRLFLSRGASYYVRIITWMPINDPTGGFKCWRANLLKKIDLDSVTSNGYSFQIEMNYRAWTSKAKIKEIPIIFPDRTIGKSKMNKNIVFEAMLKVWQMRFGKKPWLKKQ